MSDNLLLVISGPSGVGKGTITKILCEDESAVMSVSCTTRLPRSNEVEGKNYFFITKEEFEQRIKNGGFLEYSNHFENYYGTPKNYVLDKLKYKNVILEIDVNGALDVKKEYADAVLIMVAPPSLEDLIKRLKARNTESDDKIALRVSRAKYELSVYKNYDYVVINDVIGNAVESIKDIIKAEKLKVSRNADNINKFFKE